MISIYFILLVGILATIQWLLTTKSKNRKYKLPAGPRGIPFLGNLLQIVRDPHLKFSKWAREHDSVYTVFFGTRPALILSDVQSMKEIFSHPASTGKFKTDTMMLLSRGSYGIMNTDGAVSSEQRQFCLRNLVNFGFGKKTLEPLILSECQDLIHKINEDSKETDQGLEVNSYLKCSTNNTLMTIVTGERVALEDTKVSNLIKEVVEALQLTMKTGLGFLPLLKHIAPVASGYVRMDSACENIHQFIGEYFERHKKTNVPENPRDLVDAYLDKMGTTDKTSSFYGEVGRKNSIASVVELFEAGSETTSGTITWLLYYMALHPNIQLKVHQELDAVLGNGPCKRDPSLQDKGRLPYTEAVILETMRKSPVAPFGLIHELLEDIEFQEYRLPKGMILIANIYHCHHDKNVWKDPENFRPERFLEKEEDGHDCNKLKEFLVPFQPGKRSCLGEPLAKDIMFLFVAKLLQEFEINTAPGVSAEEYFDPDIGLGLLPKPRRIVMRYRS